VIDSACLNIASRYPKRWAIEYIITPCLHPLVLSARQALIAFENFVDSTNFLKIALSTTLLSMAILARNTRKINDVESDQPARSD
jgi:hypothetical protein